MNEIKYITAIDLAFGKGKTKKWAFENVMLTALYNTLKDDICYLKLNEISNIKADEENEDEIILKFGYLFEIPRTEIDLHITKKKHLMYLTEEGIGWDYGKVEKQIIKFLIEQKNNNNLLWHSNFNGEEYKIK